MTEKIFMHRTFNVAIWNKVRLPPSHPQYRKLVTVSSKLLKENYQFQNVNATKIFYNPYLSATWTMEPNNKNSLMESSLELRVLWHYYQYGSMLKIIKDFPEISHPQQAKRAIKTGIKSLFNYSQFTKDSRGINAEGKCEEY